MPVTLNLTNKEIADLANEYNTPLQIYDGDLIIKNFINFLNAMKTYFPNFRQYFAVKALPNPNILKILIDYGSYLDCSSLTELKLAEKLGLSGDSIMFTSNYTSNEDLRYAYKLNAIINLDDISLLDNMKTLKILPEFLSFRLNPRIGKTDSETKSNILGGEQVKFGIPDYELLNAYLTAKKYGVKKFGLHIMTGSNVLTLSYWEELIKVVYVHINELYKNKIKLEFINIGGGIGIPYKPETKQIDILEFSSNLNKIITQQSIKYRLPFINLYMENGRFITGPYGWLISKCNVIKKSYNNSIFYGLDACMSNLMRPGMYGAYHHITILDKDTNYKKANVVGTLCENNDWFAKDRELPEAEVGDIFIIYDTGAHSHSMGFQYNGKLRAPELLLYNSKIRLIRRRETFEDYMETII